MFAVACSDHDLLCVIVDASPGGLLRFAAGQPTAVGRIRRWDRAQLREESLRQPVVADTTITRRAGRNRARHGGGKVGRFEIPVAVSHTAFIVSDWSPWSQTAKGIANTGDYLSDGPKVRAKHFRPKRVINASDPRVKVYDAREAELLSVPTKIFLIGNTLNNVFRHDINMFCHAGSVL